MARGLKRLLLLGGLLSVAVLGAFRLWAGAALAGLALVSWLGLETRLRTRFRFLAGGIPERGLDFEAEVLEVLGGGCAAFVQAGGAVTALDFETGRTWRRVFEPRPLALLPLSRGRLLLAHEDRLRLTDAGGGDGRALGFEPPLLRQAYRLLAGPGAAQVALATPWFVEVFDASLDASLGRVRFEDAGHYIKYAALGPGGRGLLLAGTHLLGESDGGTLEARWDWWERAADGTWTRRWGRAREGYENSQLRGVQVNGDGTALCAEFWRSGYSFELRSPDGALLWERPGGERPVFSPDGRRVAWEQGPELLVLGGVDGREHWRWRPKELIRLKQPLDDGSCLVLEGRCLRRFTPAGEPGPELWLKHDADHLAWGAGGRLALAAGRRGACARIKGDF